MTLVVHCSRCGSAVTRIEPNEDVVKQGECFRCDKPFRATPCPNSGSYQIDGSYGISGTRYQTLPDVVRCFGCQAQIPARDPGPEGPSAP